MLTGKYNEKLSQRYALQTFDKLVECDSCYIDRFEIIIYMDIKNNYYQYKKMNLLKNLHSKN